MKMKTQHIKIGWNEKVLRDETYSTISHRRKESSQFSDLSFYIKKLDKEGQSKLKASTKGIIKKRTEINKMQNRKDRKESSAQIGPEGDLQCLRTSGKMAKENSGEHEIPATFYMQVDDLFPKSSKT